MRGYASAKLHAGLATEFDQQHSQQVLLCGKQMTALKDQLLADCYPAADRKHYASDDQDQLINDLQKTIQADDIVLLKGSHGIHLENVLNALKAK